MGDTHIEPSVGDIVRTPSGERALVVGVNMVALIVRKGSASYPDVCSADELTVIPPTGAELFDPPTRSTP